MKRIGIFLQHPECSQDCVDGMTEALGGEYVISTFGPAECSLQSLRWYDIVAFPGGIGDASSYDDFFRRKAQNAVADYVECGGRYLGICMGAYWAGSYYFDLLDGVDAVQYIKRPGAEVRRSYGTVADIDWADRGEQMFFYDGCALIGDENKFKTIARYLNGDPMAIIQGRVGLIGCHPESQQYWYQPPYQYISNYWHCGRHHELLLNFVNQLMEN